MAKRDFSLMLGEHGAVLVTDAVKLTLNEAQTAKLLGAKRVGAAALADAVNALADAARLQWHGIA